MNTDELFECEFYEGDVVNDAWVDAHCTILRVKNADALPCDLKIPAFIDDEYYVTEIADNAFRGLSGLHAVCIPCTVTDIGENAFADCKNLTSVTLGGGVECISKNAFMGCDAIEDVYVFDIGTLCSARFGNRYSNPICSAKRVFIDGAELGDCLEIPKRDVWHNIGKITRYAFCGLRIKTLRAADGITEMRIDSDAFADCDELTEVILPDSLKIFDPTGLLSCKSIRFNEYGGARYLGSARNPYKALVHADAQAAELKLHADTEIICRGAFAECAELKSLYVSERLKYIDDGALGGCGGLTTVVLPDGALDIDLRKLNAHKTPPCVEYNGLKYLGSESNPYKMVVGYSAKAQSYELHPDTEIIGAGAFENNSELEIFTASAKVAYINKDAFKGCAALKRIYLPSGLKRVASAFVRNNSVAEVHCPSIIDWCGITFEHPISDGFNGAFKLFIGDAPAEDVTIPDGVEEIKAHAFSACCSIKKVTLPRTLKRIGYCAFFKCTALEKADIPYGTESIDDSAFRDCYSLKNVATAAASIGRFAFEDCKALETASFTDCKTMGDSVFEGCSALKCAFISDGVEKIMDSAFKHCVSLRSVRLSETLYCIGENAFRGCRALEEIEFPRSIKKIEAHAFRDCLALKDVRLSAVEDLEHEAFEHCVSLESVRIDGEIKILSEEVFRECRALKHAELPSGMEYICGDAFRDCGALRGIALPASLKKIASRAFASVGLEKIVIPDGVTDIDSHAFWGCWQLRHAEIPDTVVNVKRDIFEHCDSELKIVASDRVKALLGNPD